MKEQIRSIQIVYICIMGIEEDFGFLSVNNKQKELLKCGMPSSDLHYQKRTGYEQELNGSQIKLLMKS